MGENGKAFAGRLGYLKDSATLRKSEFMWILRFLMYVFLASSFLAANKQASRSAKIAAVFSFRAYHILPCAYGKQNQKISLFHKLWCFSQQKTATFTRKIAV